MGGTLILLRQFLRRDRWLLMAWSVGITLLYWAQAVSVKGLYATQAEFDLAVASMQDNAAFVAMAGPARALNTVGGQVTWQATAFGAVTVGLMMMFLVVRHTRAEEESGRDEMLRAAPVGRTATTAATLLVALVGLVLVATLVSLSLITFPLAVGDSLGLGIGLAGVGAFFAATALLAAQLTSSPRAAYGLTGAVIAAAYVLRAVGDVGSPELSWLSPIGWYQAMHAFSGLRWWPMLLLLLATAALTAVALVVLGRRDYGAGVVATRSGSARASHGLATPLGLAWRLQRGAVLGWAGGLFLIGLAYGSLGSDVGDLLGDSATSQEMFVRGDGGLVDGFYAVAVLLLALIACGYAISSTLRPRQEEQDGRLESLLATGVSRRRWLLAQVGLTTVGTAAVVLAAGLGLGVGYSAAAGDPGVVVSYLGATLPQVAPVLVVSGLGWLLYGLAPRWAAAPWLVLIFAVVVMLFGDIFRMPGWLQDLSPFHHLALAPAEEFRWSPLVALLVLAAVLTAAGQWLFTRRDLDVR